MGAVLVHIKVYNKVHNKVHNSYLASLEQLLQSFKVSRIRDACFTASLFQGFITHNSSPKLAGKGMQ